MTVTPKIKAQSTSLQIAQISAVREIRLNRPETHNAFDAVLIKELTAAIEEAGNDLATRVIILGGNGNNFSSGADLNWMESLIHFSPEENYRDAQRLAGLIHSLYSCSKPTIAIAHGKTFGGGIGLLACCDLVLAAPSAFFCFSEVKLGLIPAVISPYVIAAIGLRAAKRYFMSAELIDANKAKELQLVSEIFEEGELLERAHEFAQQLCQNSPAAQAACKKLLARLSESFIHPELIEETISLIAELRVSKEGQEGIQAFLAKREPSWL